MDLRNLGFDSWFQDRAAGLDLTEDRVARVTAVDRGGGLVRNEHGEIPFELAGRRRFLTRSATELPCVGDWVRVQYHNAGASAIITEVFPRRTFLRRKCAGKDVDFQMIAANIDRAFIVQSCHYDFNLRRFDRYLVMAREGGIEPVLVLTKTDLVTPGEVGQRLAEMRQAGLAATTLALSNATGAGLDDFRRLLVPGRTYCLLGSSGVGKTTLVNRVIGHEAFDTRGVSGTGEGMHTTARRQLIVLAQGSMMIDTPGMRELGILGAGDALDDSFADIHGLAATCRYADCRHTGEAGCSVLAAIQDQSLDKERYDSYLKLRRESEHHERSYAERRQKDKEFGKFIKTVKERMKREGRKGRS